MAACTSMHLSRGQQQQQRPLAARPPTPAPPPPARLAAAAATRSRTAAVVVAAAKAPKKSGGGFGAGTSAAAKQQQQQQKQQQQPAATPASPCPCGSGASYGACCQPAHTGRAPPSTPEKLLRSRFSGYRLGLVDYLVSTTHPSAPERRSAALGLASEGGGDDGAEADGDAEGQRQRAEAYRASIARTAKSNAFVALAVDKAGADVRPRRGEPGGQGGQDQQQQEQQEEEQEAFLSFRVWYRSKGLSGKGGQEQVVRETSHFVRGADTKGKWLYLGEARETGGEEGLAAEAKAEAEAEV